MKILIVSATEKEIFPLINSLHANSKRMNMVAICLQ
jgi:hypothetical protein